MKGMTKAPEFDAIGRAIYEARFPDTGSKFGEKPWDQQPESVRQVWRNCAVAAIPAMLAASPSLPVGFEGRELHSLADAIKLNISIAMQLHDFGHEDAETGDFVTTPKKTENFERCVGMATRGILAILANARSAGTHNPPPVEESR